MKNAVIYYAVIALGVVALAIGTYYFLNPPHAIRAYTALGAGVLLLIIGIAGMVMGRSKAVAK
jgi:uncharacterized membrane protein HdeD (DUF308 family)